MEVELEPAANDEGDVQLPGVSASTCIFQAQDEADIEDVTCNELQVTASGEATIKVHLTGSATGSLSDEATLKTDFTECVEIKRTIVELDFVSVSRPRAGIRPMSDARFRAPQ